MNLDQIKSRAKALITVERKSVKFIAEKLNVSEVLVKEWEDSLSADEYTRGCKDAAIIKTATDIITTKPEMLTSKEILHDKLVELGIKFADELMEGFGNIEYAKKLHICSSALSTVYKAFFPNPQITVNTNPDNSDNYKKFFSKD